MTSAPAPSFEQEYFERNYRNYARQNPPRKLRFYRQLVERAVAEYDRPAVLELGCAFGRFLETLDGTWDRYGLDVSQYAIEQARQRLPAVTLEVASGSEIPFARQFDAILAFDVIEHIPDLEAVAASVDAHLADGGAWVFVVPVYDGPTGPLVRWLDRDPTHVHKRSRDFWLEWAANHFTIEDWWGQFRYLLPVGPYVYATTRLLRRACPAIAVLARKRVAAA
ncbi:MAG: class I SAM-dependent methyltransferase [Pirellulales bacterium]|nr:class I SAM-dependent methyltransferase [Pirellulales bacterium]